MLPVDVCLTTSVSQETRFDVCQFFLEKMELGLLLWFLLSNIVSAC